MLTIARTDLSRSDYLNELLPQSPSVDDLYDHFSCRIHPGFKLQVLCPKEDFQPPLLCTKCLLDPEIERRLKGQPLIAIQEVINKGASVMPRESVSQQSRDALRAKIIDYSNKDYVGTFERHTDTQLKKLQREIEKVKESLDELQIQFKNLFEKQQKHLKDKEEELKSRIEAYFDEQEQMESLFYSSPEEIMEVIRKTSNVKEFEAIVKMLYHRGSQNHKAIASGMMNKIYEIMDDVEEKVNKMRNCKIHTSLLEKIRQQIDSIEILDQSYQAAPSTNVSSRLMQTLEKIRMAEEKKKTPMKDSDYTPIERLSQKRNEFLEPLKERLNYFSASSQKYNRRMETEPPTAYETARKSYKMNERDSSYYTGGYSQPGRRTEEKERMQRRGKESATQTVNLVNAYTNTEYDEDYYQPRYEDEYRHRRQKTEANEYRRVDDRRRREREMEQEEYEEYDARDHSPYPYHEEYVTDNSVERPPKTSVPKNKTHSSAKKSKTPTRDSEHKSARKATEEERVSPKKDASLDNWIKKEKRKNKEKERERERDNEQQPRKEKKKKTETDVEDGRGSDTDNSTPKRARVKDLHDWINRRVTGYLIFQNTMQDMGLEKEHKDEHLNRIAGDKWKALTKAEREEYRSLAMNARVQLKREFRNVEIDNPDIKDLQELVEKRIKKVKKEDTYEGSE